MSVAQRLYYDAQEMLEFTAEVTDIRLESRRDGVNRWQLALDRTAFYPESGGQPWDTGRLQAVAKSGARLEVPVLAVVEEAAEVWHVVEKPLSAGTLVTGHVNGARRRDHMQQHTGQHLLSAVFLRELGAATVSFHLGAETSTIDLAVERLDPVAAIRVEEAVNALIAANRHVSARTVERSVAEAMLARGDLRKLPEREGAMRIVEIDGVEWNACGGTHVASTAEICGLSLRRVERVKQGVRVEFCCGTRMVRAARRDFETVAEMGRLLSTGAAEMAGKLARMLEESRTSAKRTRGLLEEMAGFEARLLAGPRVVEAQARDLEYAKLLAAQCVALQTTSVALVWTKEGTLVLTAGSASRVDCGVVMKAAVAALGGRGGGSAGMAQGALGADRVAELLQQIRARLGDIAKTT